MDHKMDIVLVPKKFDRELVQAGLGYTASCQRSLIIHLNSNEFSSIKKCRIDRDK